MTRKDYIKAAAIVRGADALYRDACDDLRLGVAATRQYFADELAQMFAADNPNFDRARFLAACGLED